MVKTSESKTKIQVVIETQDHIAVVIHLLLTMIFSSQMSIHQQLPDNALFLDIQSTIEDS